MKTELPHFTIGDSFGGNQDWFPDRMMHLGGCGAATACDCCIDLDLCFSTRACPFPPAQLSREAYLAFARRMKPYLRPRWGGIDTLELFMAGFRGYLRDAGETRITMRPYHGGLPYAGARKLVMEQLSRGLPVPYLNLRHWDAAFGDYEWHWFVLCGYELRGNTLFVKAATYGKAEWLDFQRLWDTGQRKKGGMVLLRVAPDGLF